MRIKARRRTRFCATSTATTSIRWFAANYPGVGTATPIMFHPSREAAKDATLPANARVVTQDKLDELRVAVRSLATAVAARPGFGTPAELAGDLKLRQLNGKS